MGHRNIVVIGASAGGYDALLKIIAMLPAKLPVSIFIVWHIASDSMGMLPYAINNLKGLHAVNATNNQEIQEGRIYVAPPDHHMLIEKNVIKITQGPRENRFRPAIDPLFRSAAIAYGNRVIGIILSGALDDGVAGLWAIKQYRGVAIVQDPDDAEVAAMPENAIREVEVDYQLPANEIAAVLMDFCAERVPESGDYPSSDYLLRREVDLFLKDYANTELKPFGELAPFSCPECGGTLSVIREGERFRYRCYTGHAYTPESLLQVINNGIENNVRSSLRGIREKIALLNHLGDHFAEKNQAHMAALYFQKATEAKDKNKWLIKALDNEKSELHT